MVGAGEHLPYYDALKTAADGFDLLEPFDFEADVGEDFGHPFGRKVDVDIALEPVVGNIHGRYRFSETIRKDSVFSGNAIKNHRLLYHAEGREPSQRNTMPARMKTRSTAFARRLRSRKSTAPQRNETATEPRRIIETTEIIASGSRRAA